MHRQAGSCETQAEISNILHVIPRNTHARIAILPQLHIVDGAVSNYVLLCVPPFILHVPPRFRYVALCLGGMQAVVKAEIERHVAACGQTAEVRMFNEDCQGMLR